MSNIAVLVLAAGKSSRMGSIKQLEKINKKTLLDITLEKAKQLSNQNVFCVLGANTLKIKKEICPKNIHFIDNTHFEEGLSSSIRACLYHFKKNSLHFDGFCILLADQPVISLQYLNNMIQLFLENTTSIVASNYGGFYGVPAIFPKRFFSELLQIKGDKGAKEFINLKKEDVLIPQKSTDFTDIDTKDDLLKLKKTLEKN